MQVCAVSLPKHLLPFFRECQPRTCDCYVCRMVAVFWEVRRVLRDDGTLWIVIGDKFANDGKWGGAAKSLMGIPWRLALAMQADGWILRCDVIWEKPNAMPASVRDRPNISHEYVFMFAKSQSYFFDNEAIKEQSIYQPGSREDVPKGGFHSKYADGNGRVGDQSFRAIRERRNKRSVWSIPLHSFRGAHFAAFPPRLVHTILQAATSERGVCPQCGTPWRRIVERVRRPTRPGERTKVHGAHSRAVNSRDVEHAHEHDGKKSIVNRVHHPDEAGNRDPQRHVTETTTVGWEPGCECRFYRLRHAVPEAIIDELSQLGLLENEHGNVDV